MRKLMWFTMGFTIACAAGIYLLLGNLLLIVALVTLLGAIGLFFVNKPWCKRLATLLLGCAIGAACTFAFEGLQLDKARQLDGTAGDYRIRINDYSYPTAYGVAADGELEHDGKTFDVCVYVNNDQPLVPGDLLEGSFSFRFTGFGGAKEATYHQGKGILLLAYAKENPQHLGNQMNWRDYPAIWRNRITQKLDDTFPADTAGFAKALLLGDTSGIDYETDTDFSVSGIRHVIAVSGLHVSILFSLVYFFSNGRRGLTVALGIPVLILFAALAGFTPSIVRACLMQILMLIAFLTDREYDPPTALSFAVLVILAIDPASVTSVSLQLSVGCVIGIFLLGSKINSYLLNEKRLGKWNGKDWKGRLVRWISGCVSISLGATIATAPLSAIYFGTISLVGILTNLLILWVISFIFYGIMLACLLGFLWLPLGSVVACVIAWLIRFVQGVAQGIGAFPLAAVYTCSTYIVIWLIGCYLLIGLFFLLGRKKPWLYAICATVCLLIAVTAAWLEPRLDDYRVTMLDVGQGQTIVLQTDGQYYLVDCGGDADTETADLVAEYLLSQGIFSLDGVILTHYDTDHAGGLPYLLTRVPARKLYLPDTDEENDIRILLQTQYEADICWITPGTSYRIPEGEIQLLLPKHATSGNENSMCILFQPKECDILITGDRGKAGERVLLAEFDLPKLDVLVVGHHGAKDSTSLELLYETMPQVALISVGQNPYGHPTTDVLERLELFGCRILRTDIYGTIILRG